MPDETKFAIPVPKLQLMIEADIAVGIPQGFSTAGGGERKIIPILGGSFKGYFDEEAITEGSVLSGGGDWLTIRPDGCVEVDARFTLVAPSGDYIYIQDRGRRYGPKEVMASLSRGEEVDPESYYFRTSSVFETNSVHWGWLNKVIAVGCGMRQKQTVKMNFYRVL